MNNNYNFPFRKVGLSCILLTFLLSQNALASGETNDKKLKNIPKVSVHDFIVEHSRTDSLKNIQNKATQKADSVTVGTKSNTGASYNILFQVIYRNSFSEIFEEAK